MKFNFLQTILSSRFRYLGKLIGRYPIFFIISPIFLSAVFSMGMLKFKYNRDIDDLISADTGRAAESKRLIENLFPMNTSYFADIIRYTRRSTGPEIYILGRKEENMMEETILKEIKLVDTIVNNTTTSYDGEIIRYLNLCGKLYNSCVKNPIIKLMPHVKGIVNKKYRFKYPLDINLVTYMYQQYVMNLGGVKTDEENYVEEIKAVRLIYLTDMSDSKKDIKVKKWRDAVFDNLRNYKFEHIRVYPSAITSIGDQLQKISDDIFPLMLTVVTVVAAFSVASCMTTNWIRSKPLLGISGCISAGLALVTSFGFVSLLGVENTDINIAIPFLILGTEIDDAFVLVAAWRSTNPKDDVEERMGDTLSNAAVSITITSLTNFVSFAVGITSTFPVARIFCIYATVCIVFTYFYQITFFGGCLALSGYREKRRLHPFTFRPIQTDVLEETNDLKKDAFQEEFFMKLFRDKIGAFISYIPVKIAIILLYFTNLVFGLRGLSYLQDGLDLNKMVSSNYNVTESIRIYYDHFTKYPFPANIIITKTLNYADPKIQNSIKELIEKFESHPNVANSNLTFSWLKYYQLFWSHPYAKFALSGYNLTKKEDFIHGLRDVFFYFNHANQFRYDVVFNDNFTDITSSRFFVMLKDIRNKETEEKVLRDLWKIAESSKFGIYIHTISATLVEQSLIIRGILIQLTWITSLIIISVFLIFIPDAICAILVSISVVSTMVETVGYMAFWNVNIDMSSLVILILCVGFSVNYPTHVSFSYIMAQSTVPNERLKQALYHIGYPIFQGSVSTILSSAFLAFNNMYIYTTFSKIVFLVSFQTAFHAIFVLPVVLSFLGNFCQNKVIKKSPTESYTHSELHSTEFFRNREELVKK